MKKRYFLWISIALAAGLLIGCNARNTSQPTNQTSASPAAGVTATAPAATATVSPPTDTVMSPSATPAAPTEIAAENATSTQASSTAIPQESASPTATGSPESSSNPEATTAVNLTSEAPTSTATEMPTAGTAAGCTDIAAFYKDVTVEDFTFFTQSEPFVKTWEVRNAGDCSWGPGYTIFFDSGYTFDAPQSSPLPEAAPGQIVDISLQMTAPTRGGQYVSRWRFRDADGEIFGVGQDSGQLYTVINVGFIEPTSQATQPAGSGPNATPESGSGSSSQPTPDPNTGSGNCNYSLDSSFAQQLVAIINQARQAAGLNPLDTQSQLSAAAQEHSIDIACHDSYDHIGSDGSLWTDRVARQGYANSNSARENIRVGDPAFGFAPQYVFDRWFESQIHHDNMYYPSVSQIGISCVLNPNTEYKEFCTAVFARP